MTRKLTFVACLTAVAALTLGTPSLHAADGTWNANSAGNWNDTTKWTGGTVASGADFTATLGNVINNNRTITLNVPITIGNITAADTSHNYTISGANILTLDRTSGIPTIEVTTSTRTLTITSVIEGNDGLKKTGAGTLILGVDGTGGGTHNYTGGTYIYAGTLFVNQTGQIPNSSGTVYLGDTSGTANAELQMDDTGTTVSNDMTVSAGSSGTKIISNRGNNSVEYSGSITANDNLTILGANNSGALTISGTASTIASGKTVAFSITNAGNTADKFVTDSAIWGGDGGISYTSAGGQQNIAISGAKTYTGGAALNAMSGTGIVEVRTSSAGPANAPTSGAFGTGTLSIGATKMRADEAGDITIGNAISFTGNPTFTTVAGEKSLIFSGDASLGATRTLTVETGSTVATAEVEFSGAISGSGFGITKQGAGNLVLSGSNTYSGATQIDNGTLSIPMILANGTAQPLGQGTSPILLGSATAGTLQYTGGAANLGRDITVNGSGGGIVRNTGGAQLTLSGTLTKDGRVLTLTGSAASSILVTGKITGASAHSDLNIDGISTTLSNANNDYNGPTSVYNNGTLYSGASNVLPQATDVLLGNVSTGGVWDLSGYIDTINSLSFGGGGTVWFTLGTNPTARLTTTANLANGNVAFHDVPDGSVGKYTLISGTVVGSSIGGSSPSSDYRIIVSGSEVDLQHKAVQTMTDPAPGTLNILVGGWLPVGVTLNNTAPAGSSDLLVDLADGGSTNGALGSFTASTTVGPGSNLAVSAAFAGSGYGPGTWVLKNTDPNATTSTVTAGGTVNVGWATADNSDSQAIFGPALTGRVTTDYDGLESMVKSTSGSNMGYAKVGTTAKILMGVAHSNPLVSMEWRTQTQAERTSPMLASDVVKLSGITAGDQFTLQMDYDPALLPGGSVNESSLAAAKQIYLAYLAVGDHWMNAVFGDGITDPASTFQGFNAPDETLGHWGVNTTDHTVWAVLNYNGTFAVVPEPGTLVLLACGMVALVLWRRRGMPG